MKKLKIAIDYDDTFTADPALWSSFINMVKQHGHDIYCVTARRDTLPNLEELTDSFKDWGCQIDRIFFCNLHAKQKEMESRGIYIDIWIDDTPFAIVEGSW